VKTRYLSPAPIADQERIKQFVVNPEVVHYQREYGIEATRIRAIPLIVEDPPPAPACWPSRAMSHR
jgi:hypothetical protein